MIPEELSVRGYRIFHDEPIHELEFEHYVALKFKAYSGAIGTSQLSLGKTSRAMLQLIVEARDQTVRGVSAILLGDFVPWPDFEVEQSNTTVPALPVISSSFDEREVPVSLSLPLAFETSCREGEILFFWGELSQCTSLSLGPAQFLVVENLLSGVRFTGLNAGQISQFAGARARILGEGSPGSTKLPLS